MLSATRGFAPRATMSRAHSMQSFSTATFNAFRGSAPRLNKASMILEQVVTRQARQLPVLLLCRRHFARGQQHGDEKALHASRQVKIFAQPGISGGGSNAPFDCRNERTSFV